jgi:hypothetical protein
MLAIFALGFPVHGQSSLDMLDKDLDQIKQEHEEASSQNLATILDTLDKASASAADALALYEQAGGAMPDPTPVSTRYEHETPDEKSKRLAADQANLAQLQGIVLLHCGMLHLAILFVARPDLPTLHDDWLTWLKGAAQMYPQVNGATYVRDLKMSDSVIGNYVGFHGWKDKEQGDWSVKDVPKMYREQVLEPLRAAPSEATLDAWDVYIAMKNADQPDRDRWDQVDYPAFEFDRGCDDFAITPGTEKLQTLVALIKANPSHPQLDDWISRVHGMLQAYKKQRGETEEATAPAMTNFVQPDAPVTNAPATNAPVANGPSTNAPGK